MEFTEFIKELLHISKDFDVTRIERDSESQPFIRIHLQYTLNYCEVGLGNFVCIKNLLI